MYRNFYKSMIIYIEQEQGGHMKTLNIKNDVIHVVCGANEEELWIITAYYPDDIKWKSDFKTRREN